MISLFITGTDTDVGKTYVSLGLLHCFREYQLQTIALKPIAAGCRYDQQQLVNDDALALQKAATRALTYHDVNPFALEAAIAPHIAAKQQQLTLDRTTISRHIRTFIEDPHADVLLIEGAGGWQLPLNQHEFMSEPVAQLHLGVILVVGMKLGCLNHALLTQQSIVQSGAHLVGWVANEIAPDMPAITDNKLALDSWLHAPCLGFIPYGAKAEKHLSLLPLLNKRK